MAIEIGHDRLVEELKRLQEKLCVGHELSVKWLPNGHEKLSGEVKGDQIYVYEKDEEEAVKTLKHEFFDYVVSKIIEPYERIANKLIGLINDEAYCRKEKLIEVLAALI